MEKMQVQFVLEMMGKPQEHVTQSLKNLVDKIGNEKGIKVIDKIIHDAVLVKDSKELYTAFTEITTELDSIENYFAVIFSYFPANIEVISQKDFSISAGKLNEIGNFLVARLHEYDSIAKTLVGENTILKNKLREVAPHLFSPQQNMQQQTRDSNPPAKSEEKPISKKENKKRRKKKN